MDALTPYLEHQPVFSPAALRRFVVSGHAVGWLEAVTVDFLLAQVPGFTLAGNTLQLPLSGDACSALLGRAALAMQDAGLIRGWRNERYACHAPAADASPDLQQVLFTLERAAFRRFGLTSRAVHINGYTHDGRLWVGRRAPGKSIDPDRLDNLAAGGLPVGEAITDCVIRELWEEAGVPAALASHAQPSGVLRTTRNEVDGTHDEIIYTFDLALPDDFTPHNTDGEVAGFKLMTAEQAIAALADFTWDAGLVTAQFLRRQGWASGQP
ncbi:hypothetical protein IGB42_00505 [Andreprevotia sp. IGB-42]|uniref:NUDIX hydrolase n=1 Tax=Andreprevotia sp. IGB-42 TaxID=2497473 RepID=UPI001358A632|nr:DUF4743 domain-containing protein [Andreprevotia sp. IGB-42]KAF0815424.1 hypothetical protein IGB42_00505 [Andreprevotia sp. IGB-42]